jgi:hypothetical protein
MQLSPLYTYFLFGPFIHKLLPTQWNLALFLWAVYLGCGHLCF